jgi:hypothetical protein
LEFWFWLLAAKSIEPVPLGEVKPLGARECTRVLVSTLRFEVITLFIAS